MLKARTILISFIVVLTGCAGMTGAYVKSEEVAGGKTFALVSLTSYPVIKVDGSTVFDATDFDIIGSLGEDGGLSQSAVDLFAETHPKLIKALAETKIITLKSENSVLKSSAYQKVEADNTGLLKAKNYKYIKKSEKAAALAKSLGVDAVITVSFRFSMIQGASIGIGPAAVTKRLGGTYIKLVAYNQKGEVVWRDFVYAQSKKGYTAPGSTSFSKTKLYPLLQESTETALVQVVARLKKKIK